MEQNPGTVRTCSKSCCACHLARVRCSKCSCTVCTLRFLRSTTRHLAALATDFEQVRRLKRRLDCGLAQSSPAWWQSGHAADCKSAYAGSIPTQASIFATCCRPAARCGATIRSWRISATGWNRSGPEIRQYFIEGDTEEVPFSRQQRALVYQRAKGVIDTVPFGTQQDVYGVDYEWINHSLAPAEIDSPRLPHRRSAPACAQPYSASVFNISAMSFGSLSANAIRALNEGARRGGFYHDTGEGSISRYHREHGGDLVWEIGSGYFGCRDETAASARSASRERARPAGEDDRAQAVAGRQARPGRHAAGGQGHAARSPRRAACRSAWTACRRRAFGVLDADRAAAVHRPAARAVRRQADRLQAGHRPSLGVVRRSPRRCTRPASRRTSSSSTAARAAPARRRWSSSTTSACRCTRR
jgi:hypothetical protein